MKRLVLLAMVALSSCLWAEDKLKTPDVKLGLWETNMTVQMSGTPPIPPEALARMTPEQRARMEQMLKAQGMGSPKTHVVKSCLTKEKLEKGFTFEDRKNCTRNILKQSSNSAEIKFECSEDQGTKVNGTVRYDALDSEHVKGSSDMVITGQGHTMNGNSTFSSKWIGSSCGNVD